MKKVFFTILAIGAVFTVVSPPTNNVSAAIPTDGRYQPLESIPGSGKPEVFPAYVHAIYRFAIWAVGIAALLMITVGGFMYFFSAGNNSQMETAKGIITDAVFALFVALFAWIVLNKINPDLVNIDLSSVFNLRK